MRKLIDKIRPNLLVISLLLAGIIFYDMSLQGDPEPALIAIGALCVGFKFLADADNKDDDCKCCKRRSRRSRR